MITLITKVLDVVHNLVHLGLETCLLVLKEIIRWQVGLHLVKNNQGQRFQNRSRNRLVVLTANANKAVVQAGNQLIGDATNDITCISKLNVARIGPPLSVEQHFRLAQQSPN